MVLVMQALSGAGWLEVDASACNANTDSKKAAWDKPMKQRIATFRGNSSHAEWGIQPSGGGSAVGRTTQHRAFLEQTLRQFSICTLLDSPCGDMTWMPSVSMPNGLEYYGGDVSAALVSFNEERLADDPRFTRRFRQFDMTCEVARLTGCALIHCKDALFHLSSADALRALQAFESSGAGYLITTTFNSSSVLSNSYTPRKHGDRAYRDNVTWAESDDKIGFTQIDLRRPPFCFPPAIAYSKPSNKFGLSLRTSRRHPAAFHGLWKLPALGKGACLH